MDRAKALTRSAALEDCRNLADGASALLRLLDSPVISWVGLYGAIGPDGIGGRIPEGWSPPQVDGEGSAVKRLKVDLANLRKLALSTYRVVEGSGRLTLDLSQSGRPRSAAKPLVGLVLNTLAIYGRPIRTASTSEAARVVATFLDAFGFKRASAENQVRQWLEREDGPKVASPIVLDEREEEEAARVVATFLATRSRKRAKNDDVSS